MESEEENVVENNAQPNVLDPTLEEELKKEINLNDINAVYKRIKMYQEALQGDIGKKTEQMELENSQLCAVVNTYYQKIKTLQEDIKIQTKVLAEKKEQEIEEKRQTYIFENRAGALDIQRQAILDTQDSHGEYIDKLKIEKEESQARLEQWKKVYNSIPTVPKHLTVEEKQIMLERYRLMKGAIKSKTEIKKAQEQLDRLLKTRNEKEREVSRLEHKMIASKAKIDNLQKKIKTCKVKMVDLENTTEINLGSKNMKFSSQEDLKRARKDKRTLEIYVGKLKSQLRDYAANHDQALEIIDVYQKQRKEHRANLEEITRQLNIAKADHKLAVELEKEQQKN